MIELQSLKKQGECVLVHVLVIELKGVVVLVCLKPKLKMDFSGENLLEFQQKLDAVNKALQEIFKKPLNETLDEMPPFEQAKLRTTLAYAVQTLYLVYMKTKGEELNEKKYLERIKSYLTKIDEIEKRQSLE